MVEVRRAVRPAGLVAALFWVVAGCGGDSGGEEADEDGGTTTSAESSSTTTLSPEEQVLADYDDAQAATKAAYDPADPEHPDLLAHYAGPLLARHQTRLTEYQLGGLSNVLVSKESDARVVSLDETTAVIENCMTEVLQMTDSETRQPQAEPQTSTGLVSLDVALIDGTWKIMDGRTIEETC